MQGIQWQALQIRHFFFLHAYNVSLDHVGASLYSEWHHAEYCAGYKFKEAKWRDNGLIEGFGHRKVKSQSYSNKLLLSFYDMVVI